MDEITTAPDAGSLMKRGIGLLNENTPASLTEAVGLFDEALRLRCELLAPGDHWMAYLTAASWMNRGDALTRLGAPAQLAEALHSYDEAVAVLREAPPETNPLYRRRHAIAWMNRGFTLHAQDTPASFAVAAASFDRSIELLSGHPEHPLILACAWMNRGNALLRAEPAQTLEARDSALIACSLLADLEREDVTAAETGLKARHIICQATAELLAANPASEDASEDSKKLMAASTEAAQRGLALGRHWEAQGETRFRPLMHGLFRFVVAIYRERQPELLTEFVLENLDPRRSGAGFCNDREMLAAAAKALETVARTLPPDGFASLNGARVESLMETLRALRMTEDRLRDLAAKQKPA